MPKKHHFIMTGEEPTEHLPGKTHIYHSQPGQTDTADLLVIRAIFDPGGGHGFHYHPNKEEVLYFLSGTAEQWVGEERRTMTPGCSVHIPPASSTPPSTAAPNPSKSSPSSPPSPPKAPSPSKSPTRNPRNPSWNKSLTRQTRIRLLQGRDFCSSLEVRNLKSCSNHHFIFPPARP